VWLLDRTGSDTICYRPQPNPMRKSNIVAQIDSLKDSRRFWIQELKEKREKGRGSLATASLEPQPAVLRLLVLRHPLLFPLLVYMNVAASPMLAWWAKTSPALQPISRSSLYSPWGPWQLVCSTCVCMDDRHMNTRCLPAASSLDDHVLIDELVCMYVIPTNSPTPGGGEHRHRPARHNRGFPGFLLYSWYVQAL